MWLQSAPEFIAANLAVFGLLVVGFLVEKQYVNRPAIFANTLALNVHVYQLLMPPEWLVWYANIGLLVGAYAIIAYGIEESLSSDFYSVAMYTYSSIPVGLLILYTL